jgi:Na+/H+ antiporter NhaD/arsenite permease-like protein
LQGSLRYDAGNDSARFPVLPALRSAFPFAESLARMSQDQAAITAIVVLTMAMFVWGKFRHDIVAMGSLLLCVAAGLVPESAAFSGFSHPAVVTVACVLVLSHSLQSSGLVDMLAHRLLPAEENGNRTVLTLTGLAAGLSSIMNNVRLPVTSAATR